MNSLVTVRMLRPWRRLKAGHEFKPTGMVRSFLVRHGFAEIVSDDTPIETAMLAKARESATGKRQRKAK